MRKFGKRRWLTAGVLLAAVAYTGVFAQEQEPAPEPEAAETEQPGAPFQWKIKGETVEDFEVEFTPIHEVDRSTPKALVETYAAYGDERASALKATEELAAKWEAAVLKSLEKHEQKLLTDEAIKALGAARLERSGKESNVERTAYPIEITGETTDEGTHWVEARQKVDKREKDWETGEWKESTEETRLRFACVKGANGEWSIDAVQKWGKDWEQMDEEGNVPSAWVEEATQLTLFLYARKQAESIGEIRPMKQTTPQEAALSLFESLLKRREELERSLVKKGLAPWVDLLSGLFTEGYVQRQEQKFSEWHVGEEVEREIESVTEKDGLTVVKFKAQDEWRDPVEVRLKQVDEAWKIHKVGYYKLRFGEDGAEVWEFVEEPDIYTRNWR